MKALYILAAVAGIYLPSSAVAQVSLQTLRTCLDIEDRSKERLDCYDEKVAPAPKQLGHWSVSAVHIPRRVNHDDIMQTGFP